MIDKNDIIDKRFGKLVVKEYHHCDDSTYRKRHYYTCICDCGNEHIVRRDMLKGGEVKSCGCLNTETRVKRFYKHGLWKTRFYSSYQHMKQRCLNPNNRAYGDYGGRGIKVCDRWLGKDGFDHFIEDMYDSYLEHCKLYGEDNTSIDRINVDGNYCKENCRWSTSDIQQNNKRNNFYVEYCGEILTLKQCVDKYADCRIQYDMVHTRLTVSNWDIERALHELPKYHNGKKVISPIFFSEPHYIVPFSINDNINDKLINPLHYLYNDNEEAIC